MKTRRLYFPATLGLPNVDRGVNLLAAVVVARPDGLPLIVPRSGPALAEKNVLLFTTLGLFRASLEHGLLAASGIKGLRVSSHPAEVVEWAATNGLGVMVDPKLEDGRVVCGSLAHACIGIEPAEGVS